MGILSFRSPRTKPWGTTCCHIIGCNLSQLSLPWPGTPSTRPARYTGTACLGRSDNFAPVSDQICAGFLFAFVPLVWWCPYPRAGMCLGTGEGGTTAQLAGWGCSSHPGISKTPAHRGAAVFRRSPSPWAGDGGCGAEMGLEIVLWSRRMLLRSAERRKIANHKQGLCCCRAAGLQGGEAFAPAATLATSSVPPSGTPSQLGMSPGHRPRGNHGSPSPLGIRSMR